MARLESPPIDSPVPAVVKGQGLHALLCNIERHTGFTISLHDPFGVFELIPELQVPFVLNIHRSPVCQLAKATKRGLTDCWNNKGKVADLIHRRQKGLCGMCYLGLTERVEPIIFNSRCVGSLYYGPFVIVETKRESLKRLRSYCQQRQLELAPFLKALDQIPRVSRQRLVSIKEDVRTCVVIIESLLQAWNPPIEQLLNVHSLHDRHKDSPFIVQQTMALIHRRTDEPWNVQTLAKELKCHPNYLGSVFQKHMNRKLTTYLREARIHRAKMILRAGRFNITEVGMMCGFEGISQFNRAFHSVAGMSPREYLKLPSSEAP